jgi:hypothetical protein
MSGSAGQLYKQKIKPEVAVYLDEHYPGFFEKLLRFVEADEEENSAIGLNLNGGTASSGNPGADVLTIPAEGRIEILCAVISIRNCAGGASITIRAYTDVNGVEDEIYNQTFTKGTDPDGVLVVNGNFGANEPVRLEMHSDNGADTGVDVPYKAIWRRLE